MVKMLMASVMLAASITGAVADRERRWAETYNNAVNGITYDKAAASGSYNRVSHIDIDTGDCQKDQPQSYSGSLGPLSEDLSVHLRGPIKLSRFAVYTSSSSSSSDSSPQPAAKLKRRSRHFHAHRRHAHGIEHVEQPAQLQKRESNFDKRGCGDWVTATYPENGATFSFQWTDGCTPAAAATPAPEASTAASAVPEPPTASSDAPISVVSAGEPADVVATATAAPLGIHKLAYAATTASADVPASTSGSDGTAAGGPSSDGWSQSAYYSAADQTYKGLTFLNTKGNNAISGGWTAKMGNSLSYASSDGLAPATNSTCLADTELPSDAELAIFSDTPCAGDADCGVCRPDGVNYHGFSGDKRLFVWEFVMPDHPEDDGKFNGNMPAIWLLNGQIPRTQQYGGCSSWPASGELDVAEILTSDLYKLKATIHGGPGFRAGSDDYLARPTTGSMILALLLAESQVIIQILDKNSFDFGAGAGATAASLLTSSQTASGMSVSQVY